MKAPQYRGAALPCADVLPARELDPATLRTVIEIRYAERQRRPDEPVHSGLLLHSEMEYDWRRGTATMAG